MISSLLGGGTPGKKNDADSVSMTTNETSTESAEEDSIKVCVRVRPHLRDERDDGCVWTWENSSIYSNILGHAPYTFDHLFYPEHTNEYIFDSVIKGVVLQAMQGYHGSVFTYGQTSSGKTFTMNGNAFQPGIIPQSIHYCFESIQSLFTDREFLFRVNYIEVLKFSICLV
jgi:centromeric protein E